MTSKIKVNILADGADNSIITSDGAGSFTASSSLASSVQSVGGIQMTPAFSAKPTSDQSITANTWTKVTLGTENLDTDNNFASSRFTPTTLGNYFINFKIYSTNVNTYIYSAIYKNDVSFITGAMNGSNAGGLSISAIVELNGSTDYVEAYTFQGGSTGGVNAANTQFSGYRIIGA